MEEVLSGILGGFVGIGIGVVILLVVYWLDREGGRLPRL